MTVEKYMKMLIPYVSYYSENDFNESDYNNPMCLYDLITCGKTVLEENLSEHRWYIVTRHVVMFAGSGLEIIFIEFEDMLCTGDESKFDMGYELDIDTVHIVTPYEITVTDYRPI